MMTSYLPEFKWPPFRGFPIVLKVLKKSPILREMLEDTRGTRQKIQVIRDIIYTGLWLSYMKDFKPDILFSHFAGTRTNISMFISMLLDIPFGFKMHAGDVFIRPALLKLKVHKSFWVATISEYNKHFMKLHYTDIDTSDIVKHPCGLPLERFRYSPSQRHFPLSTILAVGRLVRTKGFDTLVRASRELKSRGFSHVVHIIGDGPERNNLVSLISDLGLTGNVKLLGYCPPNQVNQVLENSSVFVMPAKLDPIKKIPEGIPVSLMEAMAVGVPVIASRLAGIPELITNRVNGFLSLPDDPVDLANKIREVCALSDGERLQIVWNARKKIEADHDIAKNTSILLEEFRSISPVVSKKTG
ncbi:MAG: glycosyltransferase [Syntrophobacteraceae bacterium]